MEPNTQVVSVFCGHCKSTPVLEFDLQNLVEIYKKFKPWGRVETKLFFNRYVVLVATETEEYQFSLPRAQKLDRVLWDKVLKQQFVYTTQHFKDATRYVKD